jgi:hypothetical protein
VREVMDTGFKDMDGKPIFIGDTLHLDYGIPPTIAVLIVQQGSTGFEARCLNAAPKKISLRELTEDYDVTKQDK